MNIFPDHRKYLAFSWDFGDDHQIFPVYCFTFRSFQFAFCYYQVVNNNGDPWEVTGDNVKPFQLYDSPLVVYKEFYVRIPGGVASI